MSFLLFINRNKARRTINQRMRCKDTMKVLTRYVSVYLTYPNVALLNDVSNMYSMVSILISLLSSPKRRLKYHSNVTMPSLSNYQHFLFSLLGYVPLKCHSNISSCTNFASFNPQTVMGGCNCQQVVFGLARRCQQALDNGKANRSAQ